MDDEAVRFVREHVRLFLRGDVGRGFDVGSRKSFESLLNFVRTQAQEQLETVAEDEFRLITALCLLGPDDTVPPPYTIRNYLIAIARRFEPSESKRTDRAMEFAIAFGCGWQRRVQLDGGRWEQRWADAIRALSRALEPAVTQSSLWLAQYVPHYPRTKENDGADAHLLAMRLLHPLHQEQDSDLSITYQDAEALVAPSRRAPASVPSGAKYVLSAVKKNRLIGPYKTLSVNAADAILLSVHDTEARITVTHTGQRLQLKEGQTALLETSTEIEIWACTCGGRQCVQRHRLEAWNAQTLSLWAFVASAVKGLPQLRTNAFIQGIYFPLLTYGGVGAVRLRLVSIEYKVCRVCATEYEGDQCVACALPPDAGARRRTYPRLICVGIDPPAYALEERLRCTNRVCQNVYKLPEEWEAWAQIQQAKAWKKHPKRLLHTALDQTIDARRLQQAITTRLAALHCPLCDAPAPRRATIVWVRQFVRRVEWEARHLPGD